MELDDLDDLDGEIVPVDPARAQAPIGSATTVTTLSRRTFGRYTTSSRRTFSAAGRYRG